MAKKIRIKILKSCYQNGRVCKAGEIVEVEEVVGKEAIWLKKAELAPEKETKPPEAGGGSDKAEKKDKGGTK